MTSPGSDPRQSAAELEALVERIIASGILGKSRTYASILRYLANCSLQGTAPKEMSIAIDVLQRDADFDISRDSIVRVHVYHLRNKLQKYFERHGQDEPFQILIPKGQYELSIVRNVEATPPDSPPSDNAEDSEADAEELGQVSNHRRLPSRPLLLALLALTVLLNAWQWHTRDEAAGATIAEAQPMSAYRFWSNVMDDELPIILIVGDYYIFGETDPEGRVERLVRDFEINSASELAWQRSSDSGSRYVDLNLSYVPTGATKAMAYVLPLLSERDDRVQVKTMSELRTADLASSHIIYLGLLSGLGILHDLMFAASGLYIGATYDELYTTEGNDYYFTSNAQQSAGAFLDYGMISTFQGPRGNQFLMLAGMRDAGLANIAEQAVNEATLRSLAEDLDLEPERMVSLEALYRVNGLDSTNFDSQLVYSKALNSAVIWEARLVGQPSALSAH